MFQMFLKHALDRCTTLQGTNISPKNGILKMIFLFLRWDMLVLWRVCQFNTLLHWATNTKTVETVLNSNQKRVKRSQLVKRPTFHGNGQGIFFFRVLTWNVARNGIHYDDRYRWYLPSGGKKTTVETSKQRSSQGMTGKL